MATLSMIQVTQKFFASSSMCSLRLLIDDIAGMGISLQSLVPKMFTVHFDHQDHDSGTFHSISA